MDRRTHAAALLAAFAFAGCHRTTPAKPCATASSFELVTAKVKPFYEPTLDPNDAVWDLGPVFFCTEHLSSVALEMVPSWGPELEITATDDGRRILGETLSAHVGDFMISRFDGQRRSVAKIEGTWHDTKGLRFDQKLSSADDIPALVARLSGEIARRRR